MLLVMIIAFYTSRVILQTLGASDYGIYNVVGGVVLMMAFITGPLNGATMRFLTYELGENDFDKLTKVFSCTLNIHIVFGLFMVFLAETVGLWFFYEKLVIPEERISIAFWVYQFSIITLFFDFTQIPYSSSITAHENMSVYAYVGLYEAVSKLVIVYLIQLSSWDKLLIYALLLMLNRVGVVLFYRIYTLRKYRECRFRFFWDKLLYRRIVSYAGWNIFGSLAVVCEGQGINMLLNIFFGPIANAARAISFQIEMAIKQLVNNFMMAVRPQIIKNYAARRYEEMYKLTFETTKYGFFLMYVIILPIIFEMDSILKLWLGDTVPENTTIFAVVILITSLINTIDQSFLMSFHAIGKVKFGNIVGGSFMMLSIPIAYYFLYIGNHPVSVFIVVLVINIISTAFDFLLIHYYVPFEIKGFVKFTLIPMISVAIISLLIPSFITYEIPPSLSRLILNFISTFIFSLVIIWIIGLRSDERKMIVGLIKKYIH